MQQATEIVKKNYQTLGISECRILQHERISDRRVPDGSRVDDGRRGETDEHRFGVFWHGSDPGEHDPEVDQDSGEVRPGGAEGLEEGLPEQQVDHVQRRIAGGVLPAEVARLQEMDHFSGRRLVLLRSQKLQKQVAQAQASDDVDSVA